MITLINPSLHNEQLTFYISPAYRMLFAKQVNKKKKIAFDIFFWKCIFSLLQALALSALSEVEIIENNTAHLSLKTVIVHKMRLMEI